MTEKEKEPVPYTEAELKRRDEHRDKLSAFVKKLDKPCWVCGTTDWNDAASQASLGGTMKGYDDVRLVPSVENFPLYVRWCGTCLNVWLLPLFILELRMKEEEEETGGSDG
jgi:hypothetical protein